VEAALRRLADHREISDLLIDYCSYVDRYECDRIAELFTEDCVFDYGPAFGGEQRGNKRLAKGASVTLAGFKRTSHHISNLRIWFDGADAARAETYLYAWHELHEPSEPHFELWARYRDRIVRTAHGWRIAERRLVAAGQRGNDLPFEMLERREVSKP
jgi:3-phenylpropionate/cinnamic acid dioxygenase small subunit